MGKYAPPPSYGAAALAQRRARHKRFSVNAAMLVATFVIFFFAGLLAGRVAHQPAATELERAARLDHLQELLGEVRHMHPGAAR